MIKDNIIFRKIDVEEFDKLKHLSPGDESQWLKYRELCMERYDKNEMDTFVIEYNGDFIGETSVNYVNHDLDNETIPNVRAYFEAFRVDERYQGQGLGQALVDFVINYLEEKGYTEFTIGVEDDNEIALHIYSKFGFVQPIGKGEPSELDPVYYTLYLRPSNWKNLDQEKKLS